MGMSTDPFLLLLGDSIKVRVLVKNQGPVAGSQTVLLFWRPTQESDAKLQERLIGFESTGILGNGESATLELDIDWNDFGIWKEETKSTVVDSGEYQLQVRGSNVEISTSILLMADDSKTVGSPTLVTEDE